MILFAWLVLVVAAVSATAVVLQVVRDLPHEFALFDRDELAR